MATTSMKFTLSSTLLGNLTKGGSGNGAYVFAFSFDGNGNLLKSSTLVNSGVTASTSLQLADNSTVSGGNVIVVTQQVGKGNTSTLLSTVKTIGDLVNTKNAEKLNYRYDAIEFTLANSGSDVADLTNIVQFGAPMSLSVTYSNGTDRDARLLGERPDDREQAHGALAAGHAELPVEERRPAHRPARDSRPRQQCQSQSAERGERLEELRHRLRRHRGQRLPVGLLQRHRHPVALQGGLRQVQQGLLAQSGQPRQRRADDDRTRSRSRTARSRRTYTPRRDRSASIRG